MELNMNNILLFILILGVPIYLFLSNNKTSGNIGGIIGNITNNIKRIFGISSGYPVQTLKYNNDSSISALNYKEIGGNPVVNIIRDRGNSDYGDHINHGKVTGEHDIYYKPEYIRKDTMGENDIGSTEYRFAQFDETKPSKAWVDYNVSQFPGYYKSDFSSNVYDLKQFFDKQNIFREVPDNRKYYDSKKISDPSCYTDVNGTNVCNFNNKLKKIPTSLYNVGSNGSSILQPVESSEIDTINNDQYLAYNYSNDKPMNGSNFYGNVGGVIMGNESNKSLKSSLYNKNEISKFL